MRTTVTLETELVEAAAELTGIKKTSALLNAALKDMVERESARRLAALGGSEPGLTTPPRRRTL
jgi:Arc/MetJ family transcription regulator